MSNPLAYAGTEFLSLKDHVHSSRANEAAFRIIRVFLQDCMDEGRSTSDACLQVLRDLEDQHIH